MVSTRAAALSLAICGAAAGAACSEPKAPAAEKISVTDSPSRASVAPEPGPGSGSAADAGAASGAVADAPAAPPAISPAEQLAANTFTLRLYSTLAKKTPSTNVFVSGTSLRSALGITYLGARNATAREMATALSFGDASTVAVHAKEEIAAWQAARGKADLVVANRAWVEKTLSVDAHFAAMAADAYGAAPTSLDFKAAPDDGRRAINAWVAEKTSDKIVDLLPTGSIDKSSRLVVTNAIYFKGRWSLPFEASATKDEPFETAPSKTKTTPMMHTTDSYGFGEAGDVKLLELRYEGSDIAMMIVLPNDRAGLAKVEQKLDAATYESWTKAIKRRRVALTLPKIKLESGGSMAAPLRELGMRTAFTNTADFAGIAPEKIQIDQVVQKTFVAIDENGTEAAAATGVVMRTTSLQVGGVADFKADHPFLFFLHDAKKGTILFAGRVSDPKN